MEQHGRKRPRRRWRNLLIGLIVFVVFAYAVQVTRVDLTEPLKPQRQQNLVSLLRELARPDLLAYETETRSMSVSIRMPCPEEVRGSQISSGGRTILLAPNCATTTQDVLTLRGEGFPANARGSIRWYPEGVGTTRTLATFRADGNGRFQSTFTMPDIRPSTEPQRIELVETLSRIPVGPSKTAVETLQAISETILMALVASTIGTILAIPISFIGARNLMAGVGSPLAAVMAGLIALPFAAHIGGLIGRQLGAVAAGITAVSPLITLATLVATIGLALLFWRIAGNVRQNVVRVGVSLLFIFFALALLSQIGLHLGAWLSDTLGFFSFVGNFITVLSDLLRVGLGALFNLTAGLAAAGAAGRAAQEWLLHTSESRARWLTWGVTVGGTAVFLFALLYAANWICLLGLCHQIPQDDLRLTLGLPALGGGLLAGLLTLRLSPKRPMPVGLILYAITRTILNVLRAIEPIIMGFVLVLWVGIGPFAGVLALILHSIADLGKLFSEQVENIAEGPMEAVTATGANRLQTIIYAVVPQVTPQYTAFIFYRWDINVRMSTIIGFVGGGGIGLILFRSANLTQYSQAAVMVIAIAIVVTALDYLSSKIRARII
jgi:phosphonate ABC transporter permease subunit PhnE